MSLQKEVGKTIKAKGKTLALAESVTGGLAGSMITEVPGSSEYFLASIVAYSNESKIRLLAVSESTLQTNGAVSEEAVREMADGVRGVVGADIGAACTGVAGPKGGSAAKPVGTVWFAVSDGFKQLTERKVFEGDRLEVKRQAAERLLALIIKFVGKES
ncbi:MAG: CinA family protein [Methanomassiliicoccales archaeon]|nr:CinA family protein [Methanomassiliicoccales archaeon]